MIHNNTACSIPELCDLQAGAYTGRELAHQPDQADAPCLARLYLRATTIPRITSLSHNDMGSQTLIPRNYTITRLKLYPADTQPGESIILPFGWRRDALST